MKIIASLVEFPPCSVSPLLLIYSDSHMPSTLLFKLALNHRSHVGAAKLTTKLDRTDEQTVYLLHPANQMKRPTELYNIYEYLLRQVDVLISI